MDFWRISNHLTLNGEGGRRTPARWHSGGAPIVYLAASPPGALLEILVHLEATAATIAPTYTLLHIIAPDRLRIPDLVLPQGETWKTNLKLTRKLGDAWLLSGSSAIAKVPSAILPETYNYLLNPLHKDAARIKIASHQKAIYDARLLRPSLIAPR